MGENKNGPDGLRDRHLRAPKAHLHLLAVALLAPTLLPQSLLIAADARRAPLRSTCKQHIRA